MLNPNTGVNGAAIAPPKTSYQEFYGDPNEDPYPTYGPVLSGFNLAAGGGRTVTPQELSLQFTTSSQSGDPNAFLILKRPSGLIVCYHKVT